MKVTDSTIYREQIRKIAAQIPSMESSVLITGATGMIGSCLADVFLCADIEYRNHVTVFASGRNQGKLDGRFSYAKGNPFYVPVVQDVTEPIGIRQKINYIIHTASNADPRSYALYPAETMLTNLFGTARMLEYCRDNRDTRLLLTSTFEVYGRIKDLDEYREDDSGEVSLNQVRSCYPESKRAAEILLRSYCAEYQVNAVIARLCSIYGPTMDRNDSKAHAQFIRNGLAQQDIILKSAGTQRRTYCYLMDTVTGILRVLFDGTSGEAYNIANENGVTTIADLANVIASICGTKVVFDCPDETEKKGFSRPQNCILNNQKLRELGWEGAYSLEEGITSTLKILRQMMEDQQE